jgi:hypothetical protein
MALVKKFKTPSKIILNRPALDETVLVLMDDFEDYPLKAVC